jgi:hypothetical protein
VSDSGLFASVGNGAVVRKVNLENVGIDITPASILGVPDTPINAAFAGCVVGLNYYGTVSDCTSGGSVSSTCPYVSSSSHPAYVGGIVGLNFGGTVSGCTSFGNVSSPAPTWSCAGGIAGGNMYQGTVSNCHKPGGAITGGGTLTYIGGIVGFNEHSSNVTGNDFSRSATGQQYGIGRDSRNSNQPGNDGATPL